MMDFDLIFKFKGDRSYIHGTDLYNLVGKKITELFTDVEKVSMTIHKISRKNLCGQILLGDEKPVGEPAAIVSFISGKNKYKVSLEETESEVEDRYLYNEEEIAEQGIISMDEKGIELTTSVDFSLIELVVALNKKLLQSIFPGSPGKWYFTKLESPFFLFQKNYKSIKILFVSNFNFRLTKSSVFIDGEKMGFIYFSLIS